MLAARESYGDGITATTAPTASTAPALPAASTAAASAARPESWLVQTLVVVNSGLQVVPSAAARAAAAAAQAARCGLGFVVVTSLFFPATYCALALHVLLCLR